MREPSDDLYLHSMLGCAYEKKARGVMMHKVHLTQRLTYGRVS